MQSITREEICINKDIYLQDNNRAFLVNYSQQFLTTYGSVTGGEALVSVVGEWLLSRALHLAILCSKVGSLTGRVF